jgi:hypothetical protein
MDLKDKHLSCEVHKHHEQLNCQAHGKTRVQEITMK